MGSFKDIGVDLDKDMVATIEIRRPPHNFFDIELIRQIADACEALDKDDKCRAIVLAAQGTAFCAGAKLGDGADVQDVLVEKSETGQAGHLYIEAVRLFRARRLDIGDPRLFQFAAQFPFRHHHTLLSARSPASAACRPKGRR